MQLTIGFMCRDCERDVQLRTDTSYSGQVLTLACPHCQGVSGDVVMQYNYRRSPPASAMLSGFAEAGL